METGTQFNTFIGDDLDFDQELLISPRNASVETADWLNQDMAVSVIKHLSKVFGLDVILEAVEKYEEQSKA